MTNALPRASALLPVSVITGFLGSGKTTLLRQLLKHPGTGRVALIINEFGEIGIDHDLVRTSDETLIELNNCCLCCTVGGDLARTIRDLFVRRTKGELPEFERIVIETTGLADPAPILQTLIGDPMIEAYFRLDGVVTVVDGVNGRRTLELQPEAVKQVAVADRLVLSKVDLAAPEAIATLRRHLRELNPAAPILEAVEGVVEPSAILNAGLYDPALKIPDVARWLQEGAYSADSSHGGDRHHHHDVNRHDDRIHAFCIRREAPISGTALSFFLSLLMSQRGEDLLRVKGILNVQETPETPMVIHGVQHIVHPPISLEAWPSEDRATRLVFITRGIAQREIEPMLDALMRPRVLDRLVDAVSSKPQSPKVETRP